MTRIEAVRSKIRAAILARVGVSYNESDVLDAVLSAFDEVDRLDAKDLASSISVVPDPDDPTRMIITVPRPWWSAPEPRP